MIVDTSAVVAILFGEEDAPALAAAIERAAVVRMSAASYVEAAIVIEAFDDPFARRRFDDVIREAGIVVEPVSVEQAEIARAAYRDFGKRRGHPARLNYGDCFSYALAKALSEPLLFKGNDFVHTDIVNALQRS